jgi:hypothetical protein
VADEVEVREALTHVISDPSFLTTSALQREIASVKEQFRIELKGEVQALAARLAAIDKATDKFQADVVRVPTDIDKAITSLRSLMDEKFARMDEKFEKVGERFTGVATHLEGLEKLEDEQFRAIQQQFVERDHRFAGEAEASKAAMDAALQSAKEAVSKSEIGQTKAIEQQSSQIRTVTDATNGQIGDIKDRLARIEAIAIGQASQKQETHQSSGMTIAVISIGITILMALFAMVGFIQRMPGR